MNYEKELYNRLKKLVESVNTNSESLVDEIEKSQKVIQLYDKSREIDLSVFLDVLSDFDIKMNKDTTKDRIGRTDEINGLKKLIFTNVLYEKFNISNKDIAELLGCSRASVKYYLENHENKKKYNAVRYNVLLNELNKILEKYKL